MLTASDQIQLQSKGISEDQVLSQISNFQKGFPYMDLKKAASIGDGIVRLTDAEVDGHIAFYESYIEDNTVVKFVPASGAASRMFKEFFSLMQDSSHPASYPKAVEALQRIDDFAFKQQLEFLMSSDQLDLSEALNNQNYQAVLQYILTERGLNYGFLPKGLLAFHKYDDHFRVPVEEHLVEAAHYGKMSNGKAMLHFTVSPQHRAYFDSLEESVKGKYESSFDVSYSISYSEQKPSTDTIAVDLENQPFRNDDGSLLFRPGGHGALLENLNDIDGDIIFVKNIDNVVPDHLKVETYRYKKALAGLLLSVRQKIFGLIERLDQEGVLEEASEYLTDVLCIKPPEGVTLDRQFVFEKLNRPTRICGMVKNEGEPGGGPFWATGPDGSTGLQVVETSQVDPNSASQQEIVQKATHFNPVDLVCSVRDHQGNKFNLMDYRDPNTGFISQKSKDGRDLKALELPGLWNGAMADWNTIFVEVPPITFNPVKTVNDLLREEHQPEG